MLLSIFGFVVQYSSANGSFSPWASHQIIIFCVLLPFSFLVAYIDLDFYRENAYRFLLFCIILLLMANVLGPSVMGVNRWIRLGSLSFQPSELIKIAVILALARFFDGCVLSDLSVLRYLLFPTVMILLPVFIILKQPNLGTTAILLLISVTMFYSAGVNVMFFVVSILGVLCCIPLIWSILYEYQKRRIISFMNPDADPLNSGYNTLQSKIAIGSGGFDGKGFLGGTQAQLKFLPEKHTDFAFTVFAEEFGFFGSCVLVFIYLLLIMRGMMISVNSLSVSNFGAMVAIGVSSMYFWHFVINIGMVTGILPVVGVPLPFLSYGGSIMMASMLGFGLLLNVHLKAVCNSS